MKSETLSLIFLITCGIFCNPVHTATIDHVLNDQATTNTQDDTSKFIPYFWVPYPVDQQKLITAIEHAAVAEAEEEMPDGTIAASETDIIVSESDVKKKGDTGLKKMLENQLEPAFRGIILNYIDKLVAEKQSQVKGACEKKVRKIPMRKRKEFQKCSEQQLSILVDVAKKALDQLAKMKQIISTTVQKIKECNKRKDEYEKLMKEKQEQELAENAENGEGEEEKNAFIEFFKKAAEFFNKYGCHIMATGELAMSLTVLCLDVVLTYMDVKTVLDESIVEIKTCVTKSWDDWMVSLKCTDYVPVLDRK